MTRRKREPRVRMVPARAVRRLLGLATPARCPAMRRRWLTLGVDGRGRARYALVCPETAEAWRAWRRERWLKRWGRPRLGMKVRVPGYEGVLGRIVAVRQGDVVEVSLWWRRKMVRVRPVFWVLCVVAAPRAAGGPSGETNGPERGQQQGARVRRDDGGVR